MPDALGHDLINGRACMDIGAGSLLNAHASQEGAAGPRMVAAAIGAGVRTEVFQPGDDLEVAPQVLQRLQRGRQFCE